MEKFTTLSGVAAPLNMVNVDTDMIIPKQFLKTIKRTGLKDGLFYELRWDENGKPTDFVLDQPPYRDAKVLVTGENFGFDVTAWREWVARNPPIDAGAP